MNVSNKVILRMPGLNKADQAIEGGGLPHPAVQIFIGVCFALITQLLHGYGLVFLAGLLIAFSIVICPSRFFLLIRRTRWILLSIFLIYAYTSTGEALWPQLGAFSPVAGGMNESLLQILRLIAVLACLSILLTSLSQSQFISGLYVLFSPLSVFGVPRERIAVRLALTLRYAENTLLSTGRNWRDSIEQLISPIEIETGHIELRVERLSRLDWLFVAASSAALLGFWI